MPQTWRHRSMIAPAMAMLVLAFPGCLLVRTSEHIITLTPNGSGEGIVHLIDIRSTATTDSLVQRDFDELMKAYGAQKSEEFERYGRKITGKRLRIRGDTLMAEITYTFSSLDAVEGLGLTEDEMVLVFAPDREVIRSNGNASRTENGGTRVTWKRNTKRLLYEVREKQLPPSVSLASLYRKYTR